MVAKSYVKTAQEIEAIERLFEEPRFLYEGVRVEFLTSPDFVRSVLPPGLEPCAEPQAMVSLGRWQSALCGEFDTASVFVKALHQGDVGYYNLSMLVSGEMPVVWGREVWGEVKKHGRIGVHRDGNLFYAWAERGGQRLIEIDARLDREVRDVKTTSVALEVKAYPSASGRGLESDPLLVKLNCDAHYGTVIHGDAEVTLRSGAHDPIGSIPIVEIKGAAFAEGETVYSLIGSQKLCDAADYLPYFYGRHYDDFLTFQAAPRYRSIWSSRVWRGPQASS